MLVRVRAKIPEEFKGLKLASAKLALWDSSIEAFAKSIKRLDSWEVELLFEIPSIKLEYIEIGKRFDIFLAVDEPRDEYLFRRWLAVTPIKVEVFG